MTATTAGTPAGLVDDARGGDDHALGRLVAAVYPKVRRWALVQTGDPTEAEDLSQDVMVRMIRRLDTFEGEARFDTWLYAMVRNAALDRHRKHRRARDVMRDPRAWEALMPATAPDPARGAERAELRRALRALFTELPDRQREVFDLVELQGLEAAEAAELMGVEPVSVRAHLFKARRRLRSLILSRTPAVAEEA